MGAIETRFLLLLMYTRMRVFFLLLFSGPLLCHFDMTITRKRMLFLVVFWGKKKYGYWRRYPFDRYHIQNISCHTDMVNETNHRKKKYRFHGNTVQCIYASIVRFHQSIFNKGIRFGFVISHCSYGFCFTCFKGFHSICVSLLRVVGHFPVLHVLSQCQWSKSYAFELLLESK